MELKSQCLSFHQLSLKIQGNPSLSLGLCPWIPYPFVLLQAVMDYVSTNGMNKLMAPRVEKSKAVYKAEP